MRAAKIAAFKNHLRDILLNALWNSPSYMKYTRKCFQAASYRILKTRKNCLTYYLTDHSHKARDKKSSTHPLFYIWHKNAPSSGMCLLGFWWVYFLCALSFLSGCFSSSCNSEVWINFPYQHLPWVHLGTHYYYHK